MGNSRDAASDPRVRRLSGRERQVALLVAQGLKDAAIARRLGLSPSTVGTYVRHIKQRLRLDSRAEIAMWVTARLDPDTPTGHLRPPLHTPSVTGPAVRQDRPPGTTQPAPSAGGEERRGPCR